MTPQVTQSRRARRAELGAELRRLRQLAGLSGATVGAALGVSAAKVSRIESGERPVSLRDVLAWARAADAAAGREIADLARLEWLAERALTEAVPLAALRAEGGVAGIQADIASRLERTSRFIASFCPCYLTGLLQTAEYARRVFTTTSPPDGVEAAVAARLARQPVLYDQGRRFEFVLAEAALRWRSGPPGFLRPQLDRVVSLASLPNVAVYVVPSGADMLTPPVCEFTVYDERDGDERPVAAVEILHQSIETEDVEPYRRELGLLRRSAMSGDEAVAFIRSLARDGG